MDASKKRRIATILHRTADVYDKDLKPSTIEVWLNLLEPYDADSVSRAFTKHVKSQRWFPRPADILELMGGTPEIEYNASVQADHAVRMMRQHGSANEPSWEDPVTAELFRRTYRWASECEVLRDDEVHWWKKRFVDNYLRTAQEEERRLITGDVPKVKQLSRELAKKLSA